MVQREADALPPSLTVTWSTDEFVISFSRSSEHSGRLEVSVRYTGSHHTEGPFLRGSVWVRELDVGSRPLAARIHRRTSSSVEIDLFSDGSRFLRVSDNPHLYRWNGAVGRSHGLTAQILGGPSVSSSLIVMDPAANAAQMPGPSRLDSDSPGANPVSLLTDGGTEILVDADGDQRKDHLVTIGPAEPDASPAGRHVRFEMTTAADRVPVVNAVAPLAAPATTDTLWPVVDQVSDGSAPTKISLVTPIASQFLTIEPPDWTASTRPSFTFDFAGRRFGALARTPAPRGTVEWTGGGFVGGILWNDVVLGAYGDRFRLTLQPWPGGKAVLGVSPVFRGKVMGGQALDVGYSGTVHFQMLRSGPTSISLDLTGDRRPNIQIFDELTTPEEVDGGGPPQVNRNHRLRLTGPAVPGGQHRMWFSVRGGFPVGLGQRAGTHGRGRANAVAVGALEEQLQGASTFAQQIDQYESAMMQVRRTAADQGTLRQATYDAWAELSTAMIRIRPQVAQGVDAPLRRQAAAAAVALNRSLSAETAHTSRVGVGPGASVTWNDYTGETTTRTAGGTSSRGAGPELPEHIRAERWSEAFAQYRSLVSGLDDWIVKRLRDTPSTNPEQLRQAEFLTKSRKQLAALEEKNPTRVAAVFQPNEAFHSEQGFADHIPLNLYYYREGDTWYLKNLTNPDRTFHYTADARDGEEHPPASLFAKMNDPDRFPEGVIHWHLPGVVMGGQVSVTSRLTWRTFLSYLGVGLALVGLVLSAGTGAVAVAGAWALAGSAVAGGLAAAVDLTDRARHGDLDATTAVLDVAQIVAAVAGVGALAAGRVANAGFVAAESGAPLMGAAARTAVVANRIYVISAGTRVAADVVTLATITVQAAQQLDAIENGPGSRPDKDRAKALLLAQFAVTGGLTALSIRGELPAIGNGRRLMLRTPRGETVPRAIVEGGEAPAGVRFSQKDIGGTTGDGSMTVDELAGAMRRDGWRGDPIQVVELPDGSHVSLDNRRLWAARQAELSEIPVAYHHPSEPFPASWAEEGFVLRKTIRKVDGELVVGGSRGEIAYPKGAVPATYGEAALFRTANQGNIDGRKFPLWGRTELPRVRGRPTPRTD